MSYLKSLGIGAIWFSPIFASPMVDFGYDITNFRDIDSTYGSMDDFEDLLRKARRLGKYKTLHSFVIF